jgi:hypothetical protein
MAHCKLHNWQPNMKIRAAGVTLPTKIMTEDAIDADHNLHIQGRRLGGRVHAHGLVHIWGKGKEEAYVSVQQSSTYHGGGDGERCPASSLLCFSEGK